MKPSFLGYLCIVALLVQSSCTVKEDRSGCPCYLTVNVDAFVDGGFCHGGAVAIRTDGLDCAEHVDLPHHYGDGYVKQVPRGMAGIACAAGMHKCSLDGSVVNVPSGQYPDSLMSFCDRVVLDADEVVVKAEPHKQYCALHMIVESPESYDGFKIVLSGRYDGLDLVTLQPMRGDFSCEVDQSEDGSFDANLLRQADDACLEASMLDDSGNMLYSIDLSAALKAASYDWNSADLGDVTIRVDWAKTIVSIDISEWNNNENHRKVEI